MAKVKDPVCGMELEKQKARFRETVNGTEYYFCSKDCHEKFLAKQKGAEEYPKDAHAHESHTQPQIAGGTSKETFRVKGMHCASCASIIERRLRKLEGVRSAAVNLATNKATIEYDRAATGVEKFSKTVEDAGYSIEGMESRGSAKGENGKSTAKYHV